MEIRKLNTIRALAAMIVVLTHFSDVTGWLDKSLGGRAGQYGVMLFFLLSGFLMSYLYFERLFSASNLRRYLCARIGRVTPLYLLVVIGSFAAYQTGFQGLYDVSNTDALLSHLLFIYGESVLWTIAPEIHFYLLFCIFWVLAGKRRGLIWLLVVATFIGLFFSNYPRPNGHINGLPYDLHLFRSLPYFLTGMLLGMYYKSLVIPSYLKRHVFVVALLLIPSLYPDFSPVSSDAKMRMWLNLEVLLVMASVFFCLVFLVPDNNIILANKVGDFIGKISYSLYLLHMPVILWLHELDLPVAITLALFLVASILLAWLSWRVIEKPCATFIRKVSN
jgi:peptidoglycan/LPS O-acetylase OafA/YrhL